MRARVVVITNIPTPYRVPLFERLHAEYDGDFSVVYCSDREPGRSWVISDGGFRAITLARGRRYNESKESVIHLQWNVIPVLLRLRPKVLVLAGLGPTFVIGLCVALIFRGKLIYWTDGTVKSEAGLSLLHIFCRKVFFRFFKSFVGASEKSLRLFDRYGVDRSRMFKVPLTPSPLICGKWLDYNDRFFDIIFCGQLIDRKLPGFFMDVCSGIAERRPGLRVVVVGEGVRRSAMEESARNIPAEFSFVGHVPPGELGSFYGNSRILLFTTAEDAWGLVANEAFSCGTPVLISRDAGAAEELVIDGFNGFVLDNDTDDWVNAALNLLCNEEQWRNCSLRASESVAGLDSERSATSLRDAITHAAGGAI